MISVEVAYIGLKEQFLKEIAVSGDATLQDAIQASGVLQACPEIDLEKSKVGIFGVIKPLQTRLQADDRIEIYRPLVVDPKEARRQRIREHASK